MKKMLFISLCFVLCTCHKTIKTETNVHDFTATLLESDTKENNYSIIFALGHAASDCGGRCIYVNGQWCHFDCMSYGNVCAISTAVNVVQISANNYTATTLDSTALTNGNFFNLPSRSLFVDYDEKNNEVWLNLPAQRVYRDSVSHQFTFTGLYYSNSQIYAND